MNKKFLLSCVLAGAVIAVPATQMARTEAAIPVIDNSNILQQAKTFAETAKTAINTAQQITLQVRELTSLPNQVIGNFKGLIATDLQQVTGVVNAAKGVLDPAKSAIAAWQSTFEAAGNLTKLNITPSLASQSNSNTIQALDQANFDALSVVKQCNKGIEDTNNRIQQLMDLNASAEGQKQSAQIQNMILAEQTKLMQMQNTMRAAESSARITYYQRLNQVDANAQALNSKNADSLKSFANPIPKPLGDGI